MRRTVYGIAITLLGGSSPLQAQEDPYSEWLKRQEGQAPAQPPAQADPYSDWLKRQEQPQPAPAPSTPAPQATAPPPAAPSEPERQLAAYGSGKYYTRWLITSSHLIRRDALDGQVNSVQRVPIWDIDVVERGDCGFYIRTRSESIVKTYRGETSYSRYADIASWWDVDSWDEAQAIAQPVIRAVNARVVDVDYDDCW